MSAPSSTDPRERIVEIALAELLREGAAPDYAARVREAWEDARRDVERPESRARRLAPWAWVAAAAALVAAVATWRGATSREPAPVDLPGGAPGRAVALAEYAAGIEPIASAADAPARESGGASELLAPDFLWNPTPAARLVRFGDGAELALGPESLVEVRSAKSSDARLLQGSARLAVPAGAAPGGLGFAFSEHAVLAEPGEAFTARLEQIAGTLPIDAEDLGASGLGGPLWWTLAAEAGEVEWAELKDSRIASDARPREGGAISAGTLGAKVSPYGREEADALEKRLAFLCPLPGVEEPPELLAFEMWRIDQAIAYLAKDLEHQPELWIPASRRIAARLAANDSPRCAELLLAIVTFAPSESSVRVARELWAASPERFDTDALLALAEHGAEPFVREARAFAALERELDSGPGSDRELLRLWDHANGAAAWRAEVGGLSRRFDAKDPYGTRNVRALAAAAVAFRTDGRGPWPRWRDALLDLVERDLDDEKLDEAAMLASYVTEMGALAGDPRAGAPRELALSHLELRLRLAASAARSRGASSLELQAWLDTWREH